jgi:hypothetical protein
MSRRVAAVAATAIAMAALSATRVHADPPSTQVITAVPVGRTGQPNNGYREVPSASDGFTVSDCTTPSPSALADNIYYCSPSAASAGTCWPSTPGSLLCANNPWDKTLHRVTYGGQLPAVPPTATPDPFAVVLTGGSRCLLRNGGAWGGRDDGYVGVYGCNGPGSESAMLWLPSAGPGTCIDRSTPVWTVKVGELDNSAPPQTRAVTTAWFAGN